MSSLTARLNAKNNATGLNVVSLFDGMSCGMLALKAAGVKVANYYAAEIDKHAMAVAKHNWCEAITHVGDVTQWDDWHQKGFPKIDLLIGGSPCQSFSMAGKRKGMSTKNEEVITLDRYLQLKTQGVEFEGQSFLFWEYIRVLKHLHTQNPDMFFMLENVKMSKKWEDVISDTLGVAPVLINSAKVSVQNRERLYWTNISFDREIKDREIMLVDILDLDIDQCTLHSEKAIAYMGKVKDNGLCKWDWGYHSDTEDGKSSCVTASFFRGQPNNVLIDRRPYIKTDKQLNPKNNQNKASCLTAGAHSGGNHSDMDILIYQYPRGNNKGGIIDTKGKSPTITGCRWEQNCKVVLGAREVGRKLDVNGKRADGRSDLKAKQRFELREDTKSNCMTTVAKDSLVAISKDECDHSKNYIIRRFTVDECARLQTVPIEYLVDCLIGNRTVSKTHLYKMLGNGWTIEIIAIILRGILNPSTNQDHMPQNPEIQQDLFAGAMA